MRHAGRVLLLLFLASGAARAQTVTTIAGTGNAGYAGDGGPATSALLQEPQGISMDGQGNLYVADNQNFVIRRIDTNGIITTVAGNGVEGFSGDSGLATLASLGSPVGIHSKPDGSVLIADMSNYRVRLFDAGLSAIFTIAGNGGLGFSGDGGPAIDAKLNTAQGVAADTEGNVYIADTLNLRVRRVDHGTGVITTICGVGFPVSSGDGGPAIAAGLTSPRRIVLDSANNIFILDFAANPRIRRIDAQTGIITTVAGGGTLTGDSGPATQMNLGPLTDVAIFGNKLYVAASFRVWLISSGTATAIAGTGAQGFGGDGGDPLLADFNNISGCVVNQLGEIFLTDRSNHRIRKIGFGGTLQWEYFLPGLAGIDGFPSLVGSGTLAAGSSGSLSLTAAAPSSPALLFLALALGGVPFKGGFLFAYPITLTIPLATNGSGELLLPFTWPSGVPSGVSLYFQYAIQDAAAVSGVSLSNGLKGLTP